MKQPCLLYRIEQKENREVFVEFCKKLHDKCIKIPKSSIIAKFHVEKDDRYVIIKRNRVIYDKRIGRTGYMMKKLTMLVVDDVEVNRALLRETFQPEYNIVEAENGESAMEILNAGNIDIVILDLFMPKLSGYEVLKRMKADVSLRHIPVVVKTAIDEGTEVEVLESGADDFIFSPCDPAIVKNRVNNIARRYILEHEVLKKQIETEKHLSRIREAFIIRMSHELRGPVNAIIGMASLSGEGDPDTDKMKESMRKIKMQGEYLHSLVNDVLDIAALDRGKVTIHNANFQLNTVVSVISEQYYEACRKKGVAFSFEVSGVIHENLIGDSVRVRQIWSNLLSNAYKYTQPGDQIKTLFRERKIDERHVELEIAVEDTGCGISQEALKNIWKPFEKENDKEIPGYGGSGLGLSITKSITELMGGTISVESVKGKGSLFTVRLPFGLGKEPVVHQKKLNSMRALVIDDDEIACNYHVSILARLGINYDVAEREDLAIGMLQRALEDKNGYDICFVNWHMRNVKSEELIQSIRNRFEKEEITIVSSCYDACYKESRMKKAGVDYILSKPVFQSTIYNLMTEICKESLLMEDNCVAGYNFRGKRVMVVEDSAVNAEVLIGYLKGANLQCDWMKNGKIAVERFIKAGDGYYQAILMDVNMPVLDGYCATEEIRKCERSQARIPIIAVTANAYATDIVKAHEAGMDAYISKPIETEVLYQTLEEFLS